MLLKDERPRCLSLIPSGLKVCLVQLERELEGTGFRDTLTIKTTSTNAQTFSEGLPCFKGCIQRFVQVHTQAHPASGTAVFFYTVYSHPHPLPHGKNDPNKVGKEELVELGRSLSKHVKVEMHVVILGTMKKSV